jgi:hypothetical protein
MAGFSLNLRPAASNSTIPSISLRKLLRSQGGWVPLRVFADERLNEVANMTEKIDRYAELIKRLDAIARSLDVLNERLAALQPAKRSFRDKFRPRLFYFHHYDPRSLRFTSTRPGRPLSAYPRIAIVTPSLNQGSMIGATVDSVLSQSYPNLSYTVQDGKSTDDTVERLTAYGSALDWISETDTGQADAINRGFARIAGDVMAYLNSDDMLTPGSLMKVARFFNDNPRIDIVYSHRIVVNDAGREIGRWVLPPHDAEAIRWAD